MLKKFTNSASPPIGTNFTFPYRFIRLRLVPIGDLMKHTKLFKGVDKSFWVWYS